MNKADILRKISDLLTVQKLGILATFGQEFPYQSIVAFAAAGGIKNLLFATKRSTSKYQNMKRKDRVSIFIDNRSNQQVDFQATIGLTAFGEAIESRGVNQKKFQKLFIRKHPYLEEFLTAPDCALFVLRVRAYYVVWNFQEVREVRIS